MMVGAPVGSVEGISVGLALGASKPPTKLTIRSHISSTTLSSVISIFPSDEQLSPPQRKIL